MLPQPPHFHRAALFILLLFFLFFVFFYSFHPFSSSDRPDGISPTVAQRLLLALSSGANASIAFDLRALTLHSHLAGTPAASVPASYVLSHFRSAGLRSFAVDYSPLLSYPASASLSLLRSDGSLLKSLSLTEPADPFAAAVPPYHAYSPSGTAVAPAVYVNFGREEDYIVLHRMGIEVKGCVAIARRGGEYRGAVVARAAAKGAKALLIFKVGDLGGVERGTVLLGGIGDPLTPGWAAASDEGGERLGTEEEDVRRRFPKIPSMPVAEVVALEILNTLGGPTMPLEWKDDLPLAARRGLGPGPLLVNFSYQEDRKLAKIQNIFGVIWGREEPDRYVILGNHRDAWTFGAVDPNSGTATLLDVARRYGSLLRSGWKPRRTIILCSWDAEEFGMIGSTEWVEQNLGWLTSKAVVYLNVDCAVQGDGFFAGASPQLDDLLVQVMKQVSVQFNWRRIIQYEPNYLQFRSIVQKPEPVNVKQHEPLKKHAQYLRIQDPDIEGTTVYDTWVAKSGGVNKIERLGRADSDFSAFLHIAGVPSIDMFYGDVFTGYHTALDNYKWMSEHGDPSFNHHVAIAEIWGLLGLRLADDPVLPFDYLSYATQLHEHATALITLLDEGLSLQPLNTCIDELTAAVREVQEEGQKLQELEDNDYSAPLRRRAFNDRLMLAERGFLEAEGLQGRPWFKHLLYSPSEDSESKFSFFPGIADAISQAAHSTGKEAQLNIQREIWRVARAIRRAAAALRGEPI